MSNSYTITTIADLLLVPADRREACVKEILLSLLTAELALGDDAAKAFREMTWTDDGDRSQTLRVNGQDMLHLKVTKSA